MDPIFITLDGSSFDAFFRNNGSNCWVIKKVLFTFKSITLSHPFSEKVSIGSAQAAPALLIKISICVSCCLISLQNLSTPSFVDRSAAIGMHS